MPLDKSEGGVKTQNSRAVVFHRLWVRVVEDRSSETLTANQLSAVDLSIIPPTIDTAKTSAMILLSEPRYEPGRERPINTSVYPPWRTTSGTRELLST